MTKAVQLIIAFCVGAMALSQSVAEDFHCPVQDTYKGFGYDIGLQEIIRQTYSNLNNFNNTMYVFTSPDEIEKYDLAVIFSSISNCVSTIETESFCVQLREKGNTGESTFLMACNWYVEDGVVKNTGK